MYHKNKFILLVVFYNLVCIECSCPDVQPVSNFEFAKLAGTWHDVALSSNNPENGDIFATMTNTIEGDKINFISENVTKDDPNHAEGNGKLLPNGKIMCTYVIGSPKQTLEILLSILTFNEDFFAMYGCIYGKDSDKYQEILWVSSRTAKPEGELKAKIQTYLDTFKSPTSKVSWVTKF